MGGRSKRRDGAKELFWRRVGRQREKSEVSVRACCRQEGLGESSFYFWRRELRKRDAENAADTQTKPTQTKPATASGTKESLGSKRSMRPAFAAVAVANLEETNESHANEHHAIEIVMRDSIRVRVFHGFDAQTLCDVLLGHARTARFWAYIGDADYSYSVYDFTTSRKRDGPAKFLRGFEGYLQADAYGGYDGIYAKGIWHLRKGHLRKVGRQDRRGRLLGPRSAEVAGSENRRLASR